MKGKNTPSKPERAIIPERGIVTESPKNGTIEKWLTDEIGTLGWELFVEPPEQASTGFVLDFLSAVQREQFPTVVIQGKKISFSSSEINQAYNLVDVPLEQDEYENYLAGRHDPAVKATVLKYICTEEGHWKPGESLSRIHLKYEAKVWMHFINSRLIPASHETRINWSRAVLVFCILTDKKFDVGRIVQKYLQINIWRDAPFYFPCLVTELCKRAGLKLDNELEEFIPLSADIDQSTLKRIRANAGEEAEEEEELEETVREEMEVESESTWMETPVKKGKAPPKTTRKPLTGTSSTSGENPLVVGIDLMDRRIKNIEKMLAEELQDVKSLAVEKQAHKDALEELLQEYAGGKPLTKKRKLEQEGERELKLEELLLDMTKDLAEMRKSLSEKEKRNGLAEEVKEMKKELAEARETEQVFWRYIKERDAIMNKNWAEKFRNQPQFPEFPDILSPERIGYAPEDGATSEKKLH